KLLARGAHFFFDALTLGDVLAGAGEGHDVAGRVADHFAAGVDDAHRSVGPQDAVLVIVRLASADRGAHDRPHALGILGVYPFQEGAVTRLELARNEPVDAVQGLRPYHFIGGDIPLPAAHFGQLLGLGELALAALPFVYLLLQL